LERASSSTFSDDIVVAVAETRAILHRDAISVIVLASVGVGGGIAATDQVLPSAPLYILAIVIMAGLSVALIGHSQRTKALYREIALDAPGKPGAVDEPGAV
jgi:hypothetical protein